jgi:uncharacterized membrane protein YdbT with pleckstrin-like domain
METKAKLLFPGQQDSEKVCLVLREHWIVLSMKLLIWLIFLVMYLGLDYLDVAWLPSVLDPAFMPMVEVLKICFLMFLTLGLFIIFTLYYLNMYVITDQRIVNISQTGILHHRVSELHLDQIQDVTAEIHGLPENVFDYGDVYIQTAGETERFLFHNVPSPSNVTKTILDLYEQLPENQRHPLVHHPAPPTTQK